MTNSNTPRHNRLLFVLATGLVAISTMLHVGCANLESMRAKQGDLEAAVAGDSKSESTGSYIVEVHPSVGQPKTFRGETNNLNSIETAIGSSAAKKFRNMDIELYRKDAETGKMIKLTAKFDPKYRNVTPETDYTIHNGDRVILRQKSNSVFDKATSKIFGKLGS